MIFSDVPGKITCPYCGSEKYVLALTSGNTFSGEIWSDSRRYFPMLPRHSSIQKCPHCSRYFFLKDSSCEMADTVDVNGVQKKIEWPSHFAWRKEEEDHKEITPEMIEMEKIREQVDAEVLKNRFGDISYQEVVKAEKDLLPEGVSADRRIEYLFYYLFAYNDAKYGRAHSNKEDIQDEYSERFHKVAKELIDYFGENKTLTAELWRELGQFDKSIVICEKLIADGTDVGVVQQIMEHARNNDAAAFILHFDEE